jgi:tetratricopeptide (TPR) repeat protein
MLGLALAVAATLGLTAVARVQLTERADEPIAGLKEVLLVPPGEVIRQIDLGHHSLAADLLFIRANLYYGQHLMSDEQLPWLNDFVEALLTVDPDFKKAYLWSALATVYYQRQIEFVPRELIDRANRILARGQRRFPQDPAFPMRIAFNLYYEAGDAEAALPYFAQAASLPGAPDWLESKLIDLYTKRGSLELARQVLSTVVLSTDDPNLNQAMQDRLAHLMTPEQRRQVADARQALMDQRRDRWGYLPFDLFLVVRDP